MRLRDLLRWRETPEDPAADEAAIRRAYQVCFATEAGQAVLEDLARRFHVTTPLVAQTDAIGDVPERLFFIGEGERNVALHCWSWALHGARLAYQIESRADTAQLTEETT